MLRIGVLIGGALCVLGGVALFVASVWPPAIALCVLGLILIIGLFFEPRYRKTEAAAGAWQSTGERFIDPTSGKLVEVRYNAQTGERVYSEIEKP